MGETMKPNRNNKYVLLKFRRVVRMDHFTIRVQLRGGGDEDTLVTLNRDSCRELTKRTGRVEIGAWERAMKTAVKKPSAKAMWDLIESEL